MLIKNIISFVSFFAVLFVSTLTTSLTAHAASFDCTKASSLMEKTICSNPELSKLDEDLAKIYSELMAQLKDEPARQMELRNEQRKWIADNKPGSRQEKEYFKALGNISKKEQNEHRLNGLKNIYKDRIQVLRRKLAILRATPPTQEMVTQKLERQLSFLKNLIGSATQVRPFKANADICQQLKLWGVNPQLTLPVPDMFISTPEQKQAVYVKLHEIALQNQKNYLQHANLKGKKLEEYKKRFESQWSKTNVCDYDGERSKDTVCLLFNKGNTPSMATILFDVEDGKDFSLGRFAFDETGLEGFRGNTFSPSSEYSDNCEFERLNNEYYCPKATQKHGVAIVADQVVSWKLDYSASYKDYEEAAGELHFESLPDLENGKEIRCGYEFTFKPAECMKE
jgi:uncharacterized protein YecT (DUF1311 family)